MDKAGEALKSAKGWNEDGNGTNNSGFDGLPAGILRNGSYEVLGSFGFWWTSTPTGEEGTAWGWTCIMLNHLKQKCSVTNPMFLTQFRFVASGIDLGFSPCLHAGLSATAGHGTLIRTLVL